MELIFDTDYYNEVDDQYALAYLLANDEKFSLKAITIAPYRVKHQPITVAQGQELSFKEIPKLLEITGKSYPYYKGSCGFIAEGYDEITDAVKVIIKQCEKPTTIVCVGALTNIALAFLHAPKNMQNAKIIWLGTGHILQKTFTDTNFRADREAFEIVLENCKDLTIIPANLGKATRCSYFEQENRLSNSPLKTYLLNRAKSFYYFEQNGKSITLHDILPIQYLLKPELFQTVKLPKPKLNADNGFTLTKSARTIDYVTGLNHYDCMTEFFKSLN
jgi:inosine-uridine nucleoside N-ribohydrolase